MKTTYLKNILFLFVLFLFQISNAQEQTIKLRNSSFEDIPEMAKTPLHWDNCGEENFPQETPSDIHPHHIPERFFGVSLAPSDGETYVGLIVRNNESWESIGQKLRSPLRADSCYWFSIMLASSERYLSFIRGGDQKKVNFTEPVKLRIWGGNLSCQRLELLGESDLIDHSEWGKYAFNFSPKNEIKYIIFEAFFNTPALFAPNGNILLDNASDIKLVNCDSVKNNSKLSTIKPHKLKRKKKPIVKLDEATYDWKYHNETLDRMKKYGSTIKFRKNELSINNEERLIKVANEMRKLPHHKLVFDFGGLKTKHAKIRSKNLSRALNRSNIKSTDYEIRNSREEDDEVDWLFGKDSFYMGIIEKK